jgi:hypothetical protein
VGVELPFIALAAYQRRRREAHQPPGSAGGSGRRRGRAVGFVFFGLLAAGTLILLGYYIPSQADAFAYENAAVCKGSVTDGCVRQVKATVVDTGSYARSSGDYTFWIEIGGPGIQDQQFNLGGGDPGGLATSAQTAGTVTAMLWKGRVVEVEEAGTTSPGPSTPLRTAADQLAGLYALVAALVFWLIAIAAARARSTRRRHLLMAFATVLLAGGIFAFAPLLAESKPVLWAYPLTCAIAAVVVLPLYWLGLVTSRRKQRRRGRPA